MSKKFEIGDKVRFARFAEKKPYGRFKDYFGQVGTIVKHWSVKHEGYVVQFDDGENVNLYSQELEDYTPDYGNRRIRRISESFENKFVMGTRVIVNEDAPKYCVTAPRWGSSCAGWGRGKNELIGQEGIVACVSRSGNVVVGFRTFVPALGSGFDYLSDELGYDEAIGFAEKYGVETSRYFHPEALDIVEESPSKMYGRRRRDRMNESRNGNFLLKKGDTVTIPLDADEIDFVNRKAPYLLGRTGTIVAMVHNDDGYRSVNGRNYENTYQVEFRTEQGTIKWWYSELVLVRRAASMYGKRKRNR